jgi:predicted RNase H-like HicB family nuclease
MDEISKSMNLAIELEQEDDGRWIAEIDELDGVLVYGDTKEDAIKNVKTLALRVIADRLENGESLPQQIESLIFQAA